MITGKVARILNSRELVINRGDVHGVERGMRFAVMEPKAEDIRDPETGDLLGSVYRPKVRVAIVQVEDRMSVGRTYERLPGTGGLGAASFARLFAGDPPRPVTLETDEEVWEELDESRSYVKTGDPVQQIIEQIPAEPKYD